MRALIASLCVLTLVSEPAAAQQLRRAGQAGAPAAAATAQTNTTGSSLLDGSWNVGVLIPGRLTMSPGANGALTGVFNAQSIGDFQCTGQYHGADFALMCPMHSNPVIFVGVAQPDPLPATARSRVVANVNRSRLTGKVYLGQLGITNAAPGDMLVTPLVGTPAS